VTKLALVLATCLALVGVLANPAIARPKHHKHPVVSHAHPAAVHKSVPVARPAPVVKPVSAPKAVPIPAPPRTSGSDEAVDEGAEASAPLAEPAGPAVKGPVTAAELKAILQNAPGKPVAVGLIVDAETGAVVMDLDSRKLVYPASVSKIFSTAALMRVMKPDRVLVTEVRGSALQGGAVATLALVGAGDPTMAASDYGRLADALVAKGVQRVGKLVIDATLFDDKLPKGFDEKQTDAAFRAPVGALQADVSSLSVAVRPGKVGEAPIVEILPACGDAVTVRNEARTVKAGKETLAVVTRPAGRRTEVVVTGTIASTRKVMGSGRRRVADASAFAAGVFQAALRKRGIAIPAEAMFAKAPADLTVLASKSSPPLQKIATTTNKISQNQYAETLFKLVGVQVSGAPATAEKAEAGVKKALEDLDIHWQGGKIANGSGLYHANQVTAQAVVDLLRGMARDKAVGGVWRETLAIGGRDGTLRGRLHDPATLGRVFAKTGTLDDVVGLAGYAESPQHRYVFAMFFNGLRAPAPIYRAVHDRLLKRLLGG
jgi:D-alanyl-D-alanine carboxypeptidase/D-alanyl-D-alanine-endopeptidase (penicillin-binding protein 4)